MAILSLWQGLMLVDNIKTHYREWGSGDTAIVILHGWGVDSSQYEKLGPLLAKQGFYIVAPDLPGWGSTDEPPKPWDVSDYVDWVREFAKEMNLKQFVLFGHSFGGRVAIKYSIKHSKDLQALILCSAAGIKPRLTPQKIILKIIAKLGGFMLSAPGIRTLSAPCRKVLYRLAGSKDYLTAEGIMKKVLIRVIKEDLTKLLRKITLPTLLLWGSKDGATPIKNGRKMNKLIPDSQLKIAKGERHNLPKHIPEKLAVEITNFLK